MATVDDVIWILTDALNNCTETAALVRTSEMHAITARTLVRTVYGALSNGAPTNEIGTEVFVLQTELDMAIANVLKLNSQVMEKLAVWILMFQG